MEDINKTNKDVATQKVIMRRELKYIYPKGCILPEKRKAYRAKVRNKIEKLTANIAKVKGAEKAKAKTALAEYQKAHLVN